MSSQMQEICLKYLTGTCRDAACPKLHVQHRTAATVEMAAKNGTRTACSFYLHGSCTRETCPALHVLPRGPDASDSDCVSVSGDPVFASAKGPCEAAGRRSSGTHSQRTRGVPKIEESSGDRWVPPGVRIASQVRGKMRDLERAAKTYAKLAQTLPDGDTIAARALLAEQHRREYTRLLEVLARSMEISIQTLSGNPSDEEPVNLSKLLAMTPEVVDPTAANHRTLTSC